MVDLIAEKSSLADHVILTIFSENAEQARDRRQTNEQPSKARKQDLQPLSIEENSPLLSSRSTAPPNKSRLVRMWNWYEARLQSHPILTKTITAAVLVGCGDLAGQCIEISHHVKSHIDWCRSLQFSLMGLLLQAPIAHYYYLVLDDKLPPTPSHWTATTFLKLAIDQLIFVPSFNLLVFFFLGFLGGDTFQLVCQTIERDFGTTMIASWKLWVPATFINLAVCPPELRVLYVNMISFVWSIFLSLILNAHPSTDHV